MKQTVKAVVLTMFLIETFEPLFMPSNQPNKESVYQSNNNI